MALDRLLSLSCNLKYDLFMHACTRVQFHLKSTSPPPMDGLLKFLTPKKKKIKVPMQNAPKKFENFPLTPQKNRKDQTMLTVIPLRNCFSVTPQETLSKGGGGILNGMAQGANCTR